MGFIDVLNEKILLLDGSMGAYLQKKGMAAGKAPDLLNLESPELIKEVHEAYIAAGSDIILTNTFGATRPRLAEHGYEDRIREINSKAVEIARSAAGNNKFVAGDIGPCGLMPQPSGDVKFEDVVTVFKEQAEILVDSGVDLIVVETFFDIQELRAAMIGVREASASIPVVAFMTYTPDGKTDTGVTPWAATIILEKLGACAVGTNCSTGPEDMLNIVKKLGRYSSITLACQPNAGLPEEVNGNFVYSMGPEDVAGYTEKFLDEGVGIIGGCCGTVPETISLMRKKIDSYGQRKIREKSNDLILSSGSKTVSIGGNSPFAIIGERINPTGRKKFAASLAEGKLSVAVRDGLKQEKAGAHILDVNTGVPGADEKILMKEIIANLTRNTELPLCIDSSNIDAIEEGLKNYPGRALINSVNCEEKSMDRIFPLAVKYGAAVICLLTGESVPESVEERIEFAEILRKRAHSHGLEDSDLIFDGLALAVSAMEKGAKNTIEVIRKLNSMGLKTVLGLSNVSFGMPSRENINSAYLSLCMNSGLDAAIMNPLKNEMMASVSATSLFLDRLPGIAELTENLSKFKVEKTPVSKDKKDIKIDNRTRLFNSVVSGDEEKVRELTQKLIDNNESSLDLFMSVLSPAMKELGNQFARREKFIPHLVAGAEAMKKAVNILKPYLMKEKGHEMKANVVFATVKGDVHDIGKNICVLMLENGGYNVTDLGKSVDTETILETAEKNNADLICLSALMTTTMVEMENCIKTVRERNLPLKIIVGGAVVTEEYAQKIGADGYGADASSIIEIADRILSH